jgi:hypothetical protein
MQAQAVVPTCNPVNNVKLGLDLRIVAYLLDALDLQCFEEALHRFVVSGVGLSTH